MFKKQAIILAATISSLGMGAMVPAIHADNVATTVSTSTQSNKYVDGTYQVNTAYLKQGTTNTSTMANYMNAVSTVTISGGTSTLTISAKNSTYANMITGFSINGVSGVKNGTAWTFTLPTDVLERTLNGHVDINVVFFTESQPVDVKLDMSNVALI